MKKILIITDFIEGQPVAASVRYEDLMKHISKHYEAIVVNNEMYGSIKSEYAQSNYKFITAKSRFTQSIYDERGSKKNSRLQRILRNKWMLSIWRNYSNSKIKFNRINMALLKEIDEMLNKNDIYAIFLTVPDIHGLYILAYISRRYGSIPAVVEVRDILNHNIGKGNPRFILKKAEKILIRKSDGIIALSKGIEDYYKKIDSNKKMSVIRNGYNTEDFAECKYVGIKDKKGIKFAHVGSIYKGRNLKDFIKALIKVSTKNNIKIKFDIIGYLDIEASKDFEEVRPDLQGTGVTVNIIGSLPHKEAIKYLKQCDTSVILTHIIGSGYAIPGKTFECIGACKPIIAVTKDKELVELIDGKYGECAGHNADEIEVKLLKLLETEYSFEDRLKFSREFQANNIINFIEDIALEKEKKFL